MHSIINGLITGSISRLSFKLTLKGPCISYPYINIDSNYDLTNQEALNLAKEDVSFDFNKGDFVVGEPEKFIWVKKSETPEYYLAWLVELHVFEEQEQINSRPVHHWKIFVDGNTGEILEKFDLAMDLTISGHVTGDVKDEPFGEEANRGLLNV